MKCAIVLFAVAAVSSAQFLAHPAHHALRTQYHAQDELGQYSFGYTGGPSSKHETSAGGVTQGGFSYIDAHGIAQSRSYVADPVHGFRVAGTDIPVDANTPIAAAPVAHPLALVYGRRKRSAIYTPIAAPHALAYSAHPLAYSSIHHPLAYSSISPVAYAYHPAGPADTPEVAAAKVAHYAQYNHESLRNAHLAGRKKRSVYAYPAIPLSYHAAPAAVHVAQTYATPIAYSVPVPAVSPVAAPAVTSQYHSQDELGQYSYGYANPLSSKSETRHANGVTQGGYSYVDAHGLVQSASYVSDAHNGFRVAATNLPVAPVA